MEYIIGTKVFGDWEIVKEIAIMTELKSHANIVSCEDYVVKEHEGTIGWDILIRMELLTPMQDYLLENKMTEELVRNLAVDMCKALVFCQKKGLIHRDIKPGNIFVDSMGRFKLGDFGVARTADKTMGGMSKQGTENYMAPEVYYARPYGASVDIYSLGMVLYRLMNGNRLPFYPATPLHIRLSDRENALKRRMEGEQLPPPSNGNDKFVSIILKACEADQKKRYRTAGDMLVALEEVLSEGEVSEPQENQNLEPDSHDIVSQGDDGTVNPFEDDSTVNPFEDDSTVNPFGDIPNIVISERDSDIENAITGYCKEHMQQLWTNRRQKEWKCYIAPEIPLQIYSNAIFNIADNETKKKDVIAILDSTPDFRIPCGAGIVITRDRAIVKLGELSVSARMSKAVIIFDQLKDIWMEDARKFLMKCKKLMWTGTGERRQR